MLQYILEASASQVCSKVKWNGKYLNDAS